MKPHSSIENEGNAYIEENDIVTVTEFMARSGRALSPHRHYKVVEVDVIGQWFRIIPLYNEYWSAWLNRNEIVPTTKFNQHRQPYYEEEAHG